MPPGPTLRLTPAAHVLCCATQVYDYVVNPGHWTTDMREDALQPAQLNSADLKV